MYEHDTLKPISVMGRDLYYVHKVYLGTSDEQTSVRYFCLKVREAIKKKGKSLVRLTHMHKICLETGKCIFQPLQN